jgi:hypothetical protein
VRFNLKAVDANLYPVPGSVTLESVAGALEFHRDGSGAVALERGNFSFRGPAAVKLSLPSVTTYPVTVAGEAEGDVIFDELTTGGASFSGRLAIPAAPFHDGACGPARAGLLRRLVHARGSSFAAPHLSAFSRAARGGGGGALAADGRFGVSSPPSTRRTPPPFDSFGHARRLPPPRGRRSPRDGF